MQNAYLPIPQVAVELDISTDGVYKLIKRGKLPAIRRSERGMRVSRAALDAYQRRLHNGDMPSAFTPKPNTDMNTLHTEFERDTGLSPREWERQWKAEEIEDTTENMRLTIRAMTLHLAQQQKPANRQNTVDHAQETIHAS